MGICVNFLAICIFISVQSFYLNHALDSEDWSFGEYNENISGETNNRRHRATAEENCELGVCEDVDDYPEDTITELLKESPNLKFLFAPRKTPDFGNRNAVNEGEDESLCSSTPMTRYPRKLKNRLGQMKFIVNQKEYYQPVRVEVCQQSASCADKAAFPSNLVATCKQKIGYHRLVALGSDRNVAVDEFGAACGCVCVLKEP